MSADILQALTPDMPRLIIIKIIIKNNNVHLMIFHTLINALSAHMIHINLNMIFYTHVEHSPTKTDNLHKVFKKQKQQKRTTNTHTPTVAETGY